MAYLLNLFIVNIKPPPGWYQLLRGWSEIFGMVLPAQGPGTSTVGVFWRPLAIQSVTVFLPHDPALLNRYLVVEPGNFCFPEYEDPHFVLPVGSRLVGKDQLAWWPWLPA
ncbi:uncharacterized protein N7500_010969 [Penicillium coprophilum]|uniref:uncharacterized protein n=1 Tax=Penicillium coprophilum TaxID=36646 RepID=UPI00238D1852|nr:uncharacterized protein N7500_010969 [Penicillium coprophilum]KAJ5150780.1 hypothetical protein N7500_010969 [Penicillium coprophilum]